MRLEGIPNAPIAVLPIPPHPLLNSMHYRNDKIWQYNGHNGATLPHVALSHACSSHFGRAFSTREMLTSCEDIIISICWYIEQYICCHSGALWLVYFMGTWLVVVDEQRRWIIARHQAMHALDAVFHRVVSLLLFFSPTSNTLFTLGQFSYCPPSNSFDRPPAVVDRQFHPTRARTARAECKRFNNMVRRASE